MTTMNSQTAKQPLQKSSPPQKSSFSQKLIALVAFALITSAFSAVARWRAAAHSKPSLYPVSAMPSFAQQQQSREQTMRFLVRRVESDPQDMSASNMLAGIYIQKVRDTGSLDYMVRAEHLAHTSLASVPAVRNTAAVAVLTQVELMEHRWTAAAAHARLLARLNAGQGYPYGLLGDALIENGDYGGATSAYLAEARLGGGVGTEARLARLAFLRGRLGEARRHYANALSFARAENVPSPESIAWCRWQLGETAFYAGDYPAAEREYRAALDMFPQYYLALASLGRVLAARGDLPAATRAYEQAINVIPSPVYVGALGDLYRLTGRSQDAAAQYALVARIQRLSKLGGELYNRQYALFYADHGLNPQGAYREAVQEYAVYSDIYGADAVAWTALKAGKTAVARARIKEALRLGTQDAMLFYHAGMIARAAGDTAGAKAYLGQALALNPQFDPLQSRIARQALAGLTAKG